MLPNFEETLEKTSFPISEELARIPGWTPLEPLGFHRAGIGYELVVMILEAICLFNFLSRFDSGKFPKSKMDSPEDNAKYDSDVVDETKKVKALSLA